MKKIIIVNNNMKIGGVQKSLYNLLWAVKDRYDITLCLFGLTGEYLKNLPKSVKVIEPDSLFRYLGISQNECNKKPSERIKRGFIAAICRMFGRSVAMKFLLLSQKRLPEKYDCAISFLHNGRREAFYGGVQDFVLNCIDADKKIAFLHCDYSNCGADHSENNRQMEMFDVIAACSDGCREVFEEHVPHLAKKCVTVRNCNNFDEIHRLAAADPVFYDSRYLNIVMVSRLSREKGIERAIEAVAYAISRSNKVRLHIVGGGVKEQELRYRAESLGVKDDVVFYGEQDNPYRYMKNADMFMLSSFHEAAPLVIDEALCLGLPVLSVRTTSSREMIGDCGWVCDNTTEALTKALNEIISNTNELSDVRDRLKNRCMNNDVPIKQFENVVEC